MSECVVSSDPRHIDRDLVWRFLHHEAYWALGVPRDIIERAFDGSICFGAFDGDPDDGGRQSASRAWSRIARPSPGSATCSC